MSFTSRDFRDVLGLFPTGVAVVSTCAEDGRFAGVTVNSFTSVSLDPPLVLVSLARNLRSFALFERAPAFAVSLLREDQRHLSASFARSHDDKWAAVRHRIGNLACPIIHPALAVIECETYARYEGGDHMLLVGRVVHIEKTPEAKPRPLLYFSGEYRELSDEHAEVAPFPLEGW